MHGAQVRSTLYIFMLLDVLLQISSRSIAVQPLTYLDSSCHKWLTAAFANANTDAKATSGLARHARLTIIAIHTRRTNISTRKDNSNNRGAYHHSLSPPPRAHIVIFDPGYHSLSFITPHQLITKLLPPSLAAMPKEVSDIKQFLEICSRKDAKCMISSSPPPPPSFGTLCCLLYSIYPREQINKQIKIHSRIEEARLKANKTRLTNSGPNQTKSQIPTNQIQSAMSSLLVYPCAQGFG